MTGGLEERDVQEALAGFLRAPLPAIREIAGLAGDASTRRYYRVTLAPPASPPTVVLMRYPESPSTEDELTFVNVHRYLAKAGIPVPAIYHSVPGSRLLVLEDLGDITLEGAVRAAASENLYLPLYERSIEILVRIQWDGTRALDGGAVPSRLAFDVAKFGWEIDFFLRHAVRGFGGITLTEAEERAIADLFLPFLETLAALPVVLAHRDYHSRNLMVQAGGTRRSARPDLRVLDFQDARMGNVFYDLASLLRDSYVHLGESVVGHLAYVYRHAAPGELRRKGGNRSEFSRFLDLSALQRNVKAIGTFGYQAHELGKRFYLRFIPPTVAHLSANFGRNPEMKGLGKKLLPILGDISAKAASEGPP